MASHGCVEDMVFFAELMKGLYLLYLLYLGCNCVYLDYEVRLICTMVHRIVCVVAVCNFCVKILCSCVAVWFYKFDSSSSNPLVLSCHNFTLYVNVCVLCYLMNYMLFNEFCVLCVVYLTSQIMRELSITILSRDDLGKPYRCYPPVSDLPNSSTSSHRY